MKLIKYPDIENHRKLYDKFITDLSSLSEEFLNDFFDEFKNFLFTWLVDHIQDIYKIVPKVISLLERS